MGGALAFVLQVHSLYVPCHMVHFQGSISGSSQSLDYTQKSTILTLAVKLSVSAIIYPRWTATNTYVNGYVVSMSCDFSGLWYSHH